MENGQLVHLYLYSHKFKNFFNVKKIVLCPTSYSHTLKRKLNLIGTKPQQAHRTGALQNAFWQIQKR